MKNSPLVRNGIFIETKEQYLSRIRDKKIQKYTAILTILSIIGYLLKNKKDVE